MKAYGRNEGMDPSLLISLIARLPDTGMYHALARGGREFFGWGLDRHMAADSYDAVALLIQAAGNWKDKPPKIPQYPRPKRASARRDTNKPISVLDLWGQFMGAGTAITRE